MDLRWRGFPDGSEGKASACNAGHPALTPGLEKSPGEGNDNPLRYSCLENPMDRGAWWATVHRATKSRTHLSSPFLFRGARMRRQQEARAQFGISCPRAPLSPRAPSASTPRTYSQASLNSRTVQRAGLVPSPSSWGQQLPSSTPDTEKRRFSVPGRYTRASGSQASQASLSNRGLFLTCPWTARLRRSPEVRFRGNRHLYFEVGWILTAFFPRSPSLQASLSRHCPDPPGQRAGSWPARPHGHQNRPHPVFAFNLGGVVPL